MTCGQPVGGGGGGDPGPPVGQGGPSVGSVGLLGEDDPLGEALLDGEELPDGDALPDGEELPDGDALPDGDELPDGDALPDGDELPDGDALPDGEELPDGDALPDGDELPDGDALPDGDELPDGDALPEGDELPEGQGVPLGDEVGESLGEAVVVGAVAVAPGARCTTGSAVTGDWVCRVGDADVEAEAEPVGVGQSSAAARFWVRICARRASTSAGSFPPGLTHGSSNQVVPSNSRVQGAASYDSATGVALAGVGEAPPAVGATTAVSVATASAIPAAQRTFWIDLVGRAPGGPLGSNWLIAVLQGLSAPVGCYRTVGTRAVTR
ncbi:hypothetical protein ACIA3K_16890 [Micromonospora sp. NPDC051543]|uniref:hypothetical protein n=1 Tax=Micromonospora sp. NPDC051543 TaxID=3364287 RepID=UPI0037B0F593